MQQLDVGDFILSERVGVERKTVRDFLQSLIDGRLLDQAKNLAETFERPILILEGEGLYTERGIHPNAIRGALACITVDYHVSMISTSDEKETAKIIASIVRREQKEDKSEVPIRGERKSLTLSELQRFIVEGLPGISAVLAKRLLSYFGSVEEVMVASEEKLKEVHGIGQEKAKEIRRVLDARYVSEDEE
ncbi:hypothetical protein AKJ62_02340 [candidate division MSBL1 archaeon SCGC-AAA259D14]|uniref:ERCC4 domain-containing protein n=1 Tax=candidate division MSBL1 archaeon SCGC-AAA259D14 TaxID=1698261 RepID=A0A133U6J9_9EURY|nr:hypothetical protein AKJ62_02340 [candidate division MSBL1 archaeon SCGC-AAA259D14]